MLSPESEDDGEILYDQAVTWNAPKRKRLFESSDGKQLPGSLSVTPADSRRVKSEKLRQPSSQVLEFDSVRVDFATDVGFKVEPVDGMNTPKPKQSPHQAGRNTIGSTADKHCERGNTIAMQITNVKRMQHPPRHNATKPEQNRETAQASLAVINYEQIQKPTVSSTTVEQLAQTWLRNIEEALQARESKAQELKDRSNANRLLAIQKRQQKSIQMDRMKRQKIELVTENMSNKLKHQSSSIDRIRPHDQETQARINAKRIQAVNKRAKSVARNRNSEKGNEEIGKKKVAALTGRSETVATQLQQVADKKSTKEELPAWFWDDLDM
jgi:hypothetical protein